MANGKGDWRRPGDEETYRRNFDLIFGTKKEEPQKTTGHPCICTPAQAVYGHRSDCDHYHTCYRNDGGSPGRICYACELGI